MKRELMALAIVPLFALVVCAIDAVSAVGTSVSESEAANLFGGCWSTDGTVTCNGSNPQCEAATCIKFTVWPGSNVKGAEQICGASEETRDCGEVSAAKGGSCVGG